MQSRQNLFTGINPLLMSYLQQTGSHQSFHGDFTTYLTGHLNEVLPDHYHASSENSLNVLGADFQMQIRRPDVLIEHLYPAAISDLAVTPTLELLYEESLPEERPQAVIIYEEIQAESHPVTVIEILSPTNKTSGRDDYAYKRRQLLKADLALVEVDWLHETRSVIPNLPIYPDGEGSTPYYIAITNPRLNDKTAIYQFGINQILPTLPLPLLGQEKVICNFEAVHQQTFEKGRFGVRIDYQNLPQGFESYSQSDQTKIEAHLQHIRVNPLS